MLLPDKLKPIPELDRALLPSWITDFGLVEDVDGTGIAWCVMTAHDQNGLVHHVDFTPPATFDDTFWVRYAEPSVNCLGGTLFETEHPGKTMPSFHWDAARFYGEEITDEQSAIIARRKELTWTSPIRVLPD